MVLLLVDSVTNFTVKPKAELISVSVKTQLILPYSVFFYDCGLLGQELQRIQNFQREYPHPCTLLNFGKGPNSEMNHATKVR